jgi:hypothetical protein
VFCEKRLQTIENKGREFEKERKEIQRGGKPMKRRDLRLVVAWVARGGR